jgi:hypothetical protein
MEQIKNVSYFPQSLNTFVILVNFFVTVCEMQVTYDVSWYWGIIV